MRFNKKPEEVFAHDLSSAPKAMADGALSAPRKPNLGPTRSVIDAWLAISGNLSSEGEVQVDGQIVGDIRCTHLTVGKDAVINGNITAEALEGMADLATVNGEVEAGFERLSASQPISLRSVNGHIVLSIPQGAGAQLLAQNRSGGIEADLGRRTRQSSGHRLQTVVGGGGASIVLRNVTGGISIHSTWSRRQEKPGF